MPDVETVTRIAREKMGILSRTATGEFGMLARLLEPDEPILAMATGKLRKTGWLRGSRLVVATPQRLLFVAKSMLTRRERVHEIPLARVRSVQARPPGSLELELEDEIVALSYVIPASQLSALADAAAVAPDRRDSRSSTSSRAASSASSWASRSRAPCSRWPRSWSRRRGSWTWPSWPASREESWRPATRDSSRFRTRASEAGRRPRWRSPTSSRFTRTGTTSSCEAGKPSIVSKTSSRPIERASSPPASVGVSVRRLALRAPSAPRSPAPRAAPRPAAAARPPRIRRSRSQRACVR